MLKPLIILGLSLTFVGCATNSSTPSANNKETEKVAKEDNEKKVICKRQARVGSHFKKTQCWTVEEYAKKQEEDKELIRGMQNSGGMKGPEGR